MPLLLFEEPTTLISKSEFKTVSPEIVVVPLTSSLLPGEVVPIPTCSELSIVTAVLLLYF